MGLFDGLFTTKVVEKGADALIASGDAMFYTDEEKANDHREMMKIKIQMLTALHPFKLAQRYIALMLTINFILSFWLTLAIGFYGTPEQMELILNTLGVFQIGWIMVTIVIFYFGGGLANSIKGKGQ